MSRHAFVLFIVWATGCLPDSDALKTRPCPSGKVSFSWYFRTASDERPSCDEMDIAWVGALPRSANRPAREFPCESHAGELEYATTIDFYLIRKSNQRIAIESKTIPNQDGRCFDLIIPVE